MIEIDLIRHVKVVGKAGLYGATDVEPMLIENARLLKCLIAQQSTVKTYQSIISSPLIRCQKLAREFSKASQLPLSIDYELQEMNFGDFDGVAFDDMYYEAKANDTVSFDAKTQPLHWSTLEGFFNAPAKVILPNAESLFDFNERIISAWESLLERQVSLLASDSITNIDTSSEMSAGNSSDTKSKKRKRILVIAHGGVIRMILAHILKLDWKSPAWHQQLQIANGSLSRIKINQSIQPLPNHQSCAHMHEQIHAQFHQQVTTIAMPLLEDF
ncbi:histidine phosphatase family protein [Colwellia echini]|uniref:Phosphoglycerate mutase n=1 Tax=Colwellia echini TaxID=1982103 RepID=A0ABY3MYT3_9GAMM|nr:histidine phosphatase family protein [Colwellia echini]TYK66364.1 phosphoglycerate mutase [Colwellia echini]